MIRKYAIPPPKKPQWTAPAPCEHRFERRMMTMKNGTKIVKDQCLKCWQVGNAYKRIECTPEQLRNMKPIDQEKRDDRWKNIEAARKATEKNHTSVWWQWYDGYLKSEVWLTRRAKVFARAVGMCEACAEVAAQHVHHLTYEHVGREPLFDLVAICHACHESVHEE